MRLICGNALSVASVSIPSVSAASACSFTAPSGAPAFFSSSAMVFSVFSRMISRSFAGEIYAKPNVLKSGMTWLLSARQIMCSPALMSPTTLTSASTPWNSRVSASPIFTPLSFANLSDSQMPSPFSSYLSPLISVNVETV